MAFTYTRILILVVVALSLTASYAQGVIGYNSHFCTNQCYCYEEDLLSNFMDGCSASQVPCVSQYDYNCEADAIFVCAELSNATGVHWFPFDYFPAVACIADIYCPDWSTKRATMSVEEYWQMRTTKEEDLIAALQVQRARRDAEGCDTSVLSGLTSLTLTTPSDGGWVDTVNSACAAAGASPTSFNATSIWTAAQKWVNSKNLQSNASTLFVTPTILNFTSWFFNVSNNPYYVGYNPIDDNPQMNLPTNMPSDSPSNYNCGTVDGISGIHDGDTEFCGLDTSVSIQDDGSIGDGDLVNGGGSGGGSSGGSGGSE